MANTNNTHPKKTHKRIALADQLDSLQNQLAELKQVEPDTRITRLSPLKVGSR